MIDRTITYRLIGAGIMVLSAAIILPLILDGERPAELDVQVQVTTPPAFPIVEIAPVQSVDNLPIEQSIGEDRAAEDIRLIPVPQSANDVSSISGVESTVSAKPEAKPEAKPAVEKEPVEKSAPVQVADRWVLQIATFKSKENAVRLVEKLKGANYDAYSLTTNSLYKVYVGPEFKRETSEKMREEIKKKFNLNGIVVKYSVN
ncbi:SPOR domain-containing protein [Marinomonas polaris]|jgi:DedD protein|uniref:DedD protein n=1 Tax=Marinomonas polaris DSM 16579 TaxID=1122206 RepID=A0A1M5A6J0_9GAMM|nr:MULTISPECIES: SPOR domain-containing protein [Marinomonas]SHF25764.1 DedD protein [Marinomonas polaris DSM 16579]